MRHIPMTRDEFWAAAGRGEFGDRRAEWIRGVVTVHDRVSWSHVRACRNVADALRDSFPVPAWQNFGNPFPTPDADVCPDVVVVPGWITDYTDHPTVSLLIVEVAGDTFDMDATTKAEVYATAGIADYWVLDPDDRRLLVFRDPRPLPPGGVAYRSLTELGEADTVSPLAAPGAELRVADLLP